MEPLPTLDPSITPGPPERIELRAEPQALACDGENASTVTARVLDEAGQPVADGTAVTFSVQALGTADPIGAETSAGEAQTSVTALGERVGVVVNVSAEGAAASIRIDCR
ncbi:MAG TPA: invasin domain 3-containing protein [Dehalococcoidia bacterium]|nr:invasin domain 3-containing protein [Dehalococcoidia bacterium]